MRTPGVRAIQAVLLLVVAAVIGLVAWNFQPPRPPESGPKVAGEEAKPGATQMGGGFSYVKLDKDGKERFSLKAESMVGQEQEDLRLRVVTMRFPYLASGKQGHGTVTADRCAYTPNIQKAFFEGHVVVRLEDGFELTTETLLYRGDKGIARTESPAAFKREHLSGSSTGLIYDSEKGDVKLLADAFLREEPDEGPPV